MKATLIIDSLGPNPDFHPPRREHFATDEEFHDAQALYDVPAEIMVPAGTELSGHSHTWVHCFPDASGLILDSKNQPLRVGPGVVRAVPADAACQAALDKHILHAAKSRRVRPEYIRDEIAKCVQAARDQQSRNDAAKAAPQSPDQHHELPLPLGEAQTKAKV
ncbi:MAG: hypothetical protein KGO96_12835 [Elusimicrobia bacterium]|nr:hypothetical protein [Elusimicrobiota bacterium]